MFAVAGYQFVNNASELTYEKQTNYYISIANEKQVLKLKTTANGDIIVESKKKR